MSGAQWCQSMMNFINHLPVNAIATTAPGSNSLLVLSISSVGSIRVGQTVVGAGIPSGTTIVQDVLGLGGTGTYIMSNAATALGTGISIIL